MNKKEKIFQNYQIEFVNGAKMLDPNYKTIKVILMSHMEKDKKIKNVIGDGVEFRMIIDIYFPDFIDDNSSFNNSGGNYSLEYFETLKSFKFNGLNVFEKHKYNDFYDFIKKEIKENLEKALDDIKNKKSLHAFLDKIYKEVEEKINDLMINKTASIASQYDVEMANDLINKEKIKNNYKKLSLKMDLNDSYEKQLKNKI